MVNEIEPIVSLPLIAFAPGWRPWLLCHRRRCECLTPDRASAAAYRAIAGMPGREGRMPVAEARDFGGILSGGGVRQSGRAVIS
jgi:hypothetical protein